MTLTCQSEFIYSPLWNIRNCSNLYQNSFMEEYRLGSYRKVFNLIVKKLPDQSKFDVNTYINPIPKRIISKLIRRLKWWKGGLVWSYRLAGKAGANDAIRKFLLHNDFATECKTDTPQQTKNTDEPQFIILTEKGKKLKQLGSYERYSMYIWFNNLSLPFQSKAHPKLTYWTVGISHFIISWISINSSQG